MDGIGWLAASLAIVAFLLPGIAAAGPGWLLPWMRGRILRPRLWGWGAILLSVFFASTALTVVVSHGGGDVAFLVGIPFGGLGLVLTKLGLLPGRSTTSKHD